VTDVLDVRGNESSEEILVAFNNAPNGPIGIGQLSRDFSWVCWGAAQKAREIAVVHAANGVYLSP